VAPNLEHHQEDSNRSKESSRGVVMSDRFDLEQQILEAWKVTDDIRTVLSHGDKEDMTANFEALARLTDIRFEKLWYIFEQMCASKQFADMRSINEELTHGQSN
jgi:hypothetical protein